MTVTRLSDLRHLVTLQEATVTPDGLGGGARGWADVATVWAQVTPAGGGERVMGGGERSIVSHRIRIRYRDGVTAKMRVSYDGRLFNVLAVTDDGERHRYLDLTCVEGQS